MVTDNIPASTWNGVFSLIGLLLKAFTLFLLANLRYYAKKFWENPNQSG